MITANRKARHEYFIEDTFTAGLVLVGTEVKSLRAGKVNVAPGYDGVFGKVSVFRKAEGDFKPAGPVQMKLV